jgi:hypothetical protein
LPGVGRSEIEDGMQVRLYGSGRWAPVRETAGMSARCLQGASCWCVSCSLRLECAGQGAHREVGSEGFEANCRAVAELTANRSARSRRYRACTTEAKEVLGEPGRNKVCAGGTAGKQHALPREVSYGPGPTGLGTWAYKPLGEVAGDAVREVGVAHGTQEPGKSKSPGIVPSWGGGMATQTAPSRGKGSRWIGRPTRGIG